ncbi:DsbA family oxidoreductase [Dechloromonas sp. XY25]|uniref:DsbA family oxidoreductase n=1 Tax=Dechloromonas hankyongensis TaxID=2908002 RepID=A0ABS9K0Z4_9RHOO|nr:DsbA family oxidoreductase [Dechloromonas hankyongensis]MCG2576844.1 DsbA family oxidoreductase [Dechloromonas hankyongensis]
MLTIEIVSDVVCPWCFIGLRRLSTAIELVRRDIPDFHCRKLWLPFFLNPDTPPEGEPYLPFLVAKFGSRERVEAIFERVREAGREYGLEYAFDKIALRANTLRAHRLIHWAQQRGDAEVLVERLFVAQFQRGEPIGDLGLLAAIAGECGYPADEVAAYLASDRDVELLRAMEAEIRAVGIRSVPTFIVDRKRVVVGAEDPAVLAAAIRETIARG